MTWINHLATRFSNSRVLQTEKCFIQDRCPINLNSIPDPSVILDADELKTRVEDVDNVIGGSPFCDLVALFDTDRRPTAILIEAKTDQTHTNARTREAINQLSWSFDHFDSVSSICVLLPIECTLYPVFTFTKISDAVLRSPSVKQEARDFRRRHRTRVRFIPAGIDIWQSIQPNRS